MKKKQVAIIGMGRFGQAVAVELERQHIPVLAIDSNEVKINEIKNEVRNSLIMDATRRDTFLEAGLDSFDTVVVAIGNNITASILCTLLLKEIGVKNVIAKAVDYYHSLILEKVGADRVVLPDKDMGIRLARSLVSPNVLDYIELGQDFSVIELKAPEWMFAKTLAELDLRRTRRVSVIAIKRGTKVNSAPGGEDPVVPGDTLVLSGSSEAIQAIDK